MYYIRCVLCNIIGGACFGEYHFEMTDILKYPSLMAYDRNVGAVIYWTKMVDLWFFMQCMLISPFVQKRFLRNWLFNGNDVLITLVRSSSGRHLQHRYDPT